MKKIIVLVLVVLVLGAGGAAAWWKFAHQSDPFANAKALMEKGDLRAAQIELRNAVRQDPTNAEAHFRLGLLQLRMGDPVAAEKELRLARDNGFDPRNTTPMLAQAYLTQGKFRELLKDFPADGLPPEQAAPLLVMRGLAQLQLNDLDGAQAAFAQAEKVMPTFADAPLAAARAMIARREYAAAEQKVDRALAINPKLADAQVLKAQLLNLKGDKTGALAVLDSAIAAAPGSISARLERANLLLGQGQDAKAREDVDAVLKIEPRTAGAVYLQAVLAARAKDFTAADVALTKIAPILSRFPRGYYFQAVVKFNLGQPEQAAEAATKYLSRNPADPDAAKLLARIDLAGGRPDQAVDVLTKAVGAGLTDADTMDLLGRAYAQSGRQQLALQSFEKAAELAPGNPDILTRLASTRLGMGDSGGATKDLEHSLELAPQRSETGEALVVAALAAGDVDRAVAALEKLRQTQGNTEAVGNLAGMVKLAQLDLTGARDAFAAVLKDKPDSVAARLNLAKIAGLMGKPADAEQYLLDILKQQPANDQALSVMVPIMVNDGRIARAQALLDAARAAVPANNRLVVVSSDLYIRSKDYQKAIDLLDAAQKGQPPSPLLIAARARVLAAQGDTAGAEQAYRQIITQNPKDIGARSALIDLLVATKQTDAARQAILDGLKAVPGNTSLLQGLVAFDLRFSGLDTALATADTLAKDPANMPFARQLKGDTYLSARRYADAAAAFAAEAKADPVSTLVIRQASALNLAGKPDEARKVLTDWLAKQPDDMDAMLLQVSFDLAAKRLPDAEKTLRTILEKRPNDVPTLNNLAWVLQQRGDPSARTVAQKAYLLGPSPQVADTLGWILASQGQATTALPLLRQASQQLPTDPSIAYHLAVALNAAGQKDDAVSALRPFVTGPKDFEEKPAAKKLFDDLGGK